MGKKNSQSNINEYIYNEYIFNNESLTNKSDVIKNIGLLVDNKLATKFSGSYDLLYNRGFQRFNFICKKMCEWNKELKEYLIKADYSNDDWRTNKAGMSKELKEILSFKFPEGVYYAELKSKKTDEFAVLEVNSQESDSTLLYFSFYFIGKKCIKNNDKFNEEFEKVRSSIPVEKNERITYTNDKPVNFVKFKSFDKMVFKDKDDIIKYIDNWVASIPTYYEYGIIPKLSILLYGEPGTGKSTFCKALASHLGIENITSVSPDYFTVTDFSSRGSNKIKNAGFCEQTIFSIDDIDCIGRSREKDESVKNGQITSSLLEFLDNPPSFYYKAKDGKYYQVSIVCATTNYYDRLDSAVKRFGRFDLTIPMNRFTKDEAIEMCNLYDLNLSDIYHDKIEDSTTFSPAQIQALCMENVDMKLKSND